MAVGVSGGGALTAGAAGAGDSDAAADDAVSFCVGPDGGGAIARTFGTRIVDEGASERLVMVVGAFLGEVSIFPRRWNSTRHAP